MASDSNYAARATSLCKRLSNYMVNNGVLEGIEIVTLTILEYESIGKGR